MHVTLIDDARIVFPGEKQARGSLLIEDGIIGAIDPPAERVPAGTQRIDGRGRLLTPGLIDMHTHGLLGHGYDSVGDDLAAACRELPRFGTTCVIPTPVPDMEPGCIEKMGLLAAAEVSADGACVPGLHMEGPFMALTGAGCRTVAGDVALAREFIDACAGRMLVMSLSPEVDNILPVIRLLREQGVVPFMTHTAATVEQAVAAIDAGARHATHFYDVFYPPPETDGGVRPVGIVEAMLADPRATVDFIADGVHVHPMAIRAAVAAKGPRGVSLITDSNLVAGLPPGCHPTPWGFPVRVGSAGGARIADENHPGNGALAGSTLTMNRGIANLLQWLDLPAEQVWAMGTRNPADVLGLTNKGRIEPGADADLVLWEDDLQPAATWVGGRCVHGNP